MGVQTGSANAIDYTEDYAKLLQQAIAANETLMGIKDEAKRSADAAERMADTLENMLERMSNESLGVYQRTISEPDLHSFGRAASVTSLKAAGRLEAVFEEMQNPTAFPETV